MEWSPRMAALDLHRGLDLTAQTREVLKYFEQELHKAYMHGRTDVMDQLDNSEPLSAAQLRSLER